MQKLLVLGGTRFVGPHDPTERFPYWPRRPAADTRAWDVARGGAAPGTDPLPSEEERAVLEKVG